MLLLYSLEVTEAKESKNNLDRLSDYLNVSAKIKCLFVYLFTLDGLRKVASLKSSLQPGRVVTLRSLAGRIIMF